MSKEALASILRATGDKRVATNAMALASDLDVAVKALEAVVGEWKAASGSREGRVAHKHLNAACGHANEALARVRPCVGGGGS